jgi:hypothetical protein
MVAAYAIKGSVSSENRCLAGNMFAWSNGIVCEGYLDGRNSSNDYAGTVISLMCLATVCFMFLAFNGLSQLVQSSRTSRNFIGMIGKSCISKVVSHRVVYSHTLVVGHGLNASSQPISGILELNRRELIHLLSIAIGTLEVKNECLASAKALRSEGNMVCIAGQYHWMLRQIIMLRRFVLALALIGGLMANRYGVSLGSIPKVRMLVRRIYVKKVIPRSVSDKRKCDKEWNMALCTLINGYFRKVLQEPNCLEPRAHKIV